MYNSLVLLFFSSFFVAVPVVILLYCSCRSRLSSKISQTQTQTFARASRIGRKQSANTDRQTKLKPASNSASLVLSLTHLLQFLQSTFNRPLPHFLVAPSNFFLLVIPLFYFIFFFTLPPQNPFRSSTLRLFNSH